MRQQFCKIAMKIHFLHAFIVILMFNCLLIVSHDAFALTKPTLTSPSNNTEITTASQTFSWSHPFNDQYEIKIKTNGGTLKYASGRISSKSKTVNLSSIPLTYGSTYKWYVVVYANGQEDSSNDGSFTYKFSGRVDVSGGVNVSPSNVTVGQNFAVSFNLKEFQGGNKTFEYVELWIQNSSGGDLYMAQRWNNVTFSANQQQAFSANTFLDPAQGRGAGTYRAIVRGKVSGDVPFNFGVVSGSGAVNPKSFNAVLPATAGRVDVSAGVSVSPSNVTVGQNFAVSFNLKEFQGGNKTFEYVELWIQNSSGGDLYMAQRWSNVTFSANQQQAFSANTFLDPAQGRGAGTYRAIVRGKVSGDVPFNFGVVSGSGAVNPKSFNAVLPATAGRVDVSAGVTISPSTVTVGQNFAVSFNLKEFQGGNKTFEYVELWIQNSSGGDLYMVDHWDTVSFSANQQQTFSANTYLDPAKGRGVGTYRAIVRGKVAGDVPFNFGVVNGSGAVNPQSFNAVLPVTIGLVDVSGGVRVSPSTVTVGQNFAVSFDLKEFQGGNKAFEYVDMWIQNSNGIDLFMAQRWSNVTFSANQQQTFSANTFLDPAQGRSAGSYRAIVRGKIAGDVPFNFGVVNGSGAVNPQSFNAVLSTDQTDVPPAVKATGQRPETTDMPPTADPSPGKKKGLVLIAHGWNSDVSLWANQMRDRIDSIAKNDPDVKWTVLAYPWAVASGYSGCMEKETVPPMALSCKLPWDAYTNARTIGETLGKNLAKNEYDYIHFIGHSAGSNLIDTAATWLRIQAANKHLKIPTIHSTFLDAYDILRNDSMYGLSSDWAEQYVDTRRVFISGLDDTDIKLKHAYNFDITDLDPDRLNVLGPDVHAWPYEYYQTTIGSPPGYGFPLSLESRKISSLPKEIFQFSNTCVLTLTHPICSDSPQLRVPEAVLDLECSDVFECSSNFIISTAQSPTGSAILDKFIPGASTVVRMFSGSPVWVSFQINVTQPINTLLFDYSFLSQNAEGLLSVFVDNQVVYKADQRFAENGVNSSNEVPIGEVAKGIHTVSFRLDPFTDVQAAIEISNIQTGVFRLVDSTRIDALFDWAEAKYPQYFPVHAISADVEDYYARYYPGTNNYLGTKDGRVYVYGDRFNGLLNAGSLIEWLKSLPPDVLTPEGRARIDALFDWAEANYPQYFPAHAVSNNVEGYYARYYAGTDNYLGTKDGNVYVYGDEFNGLLNVGGLSEWLNNLGM